MELRGFGQANVKIRVLFVIDQNSHISAKKRIVLSSHQLTGQKGYCRYVSADFFCHGKHLIRISCLTRLGKPSYG